MGNIGKIILGVIVGAAFSVLAQHAEARVNEGCFVTRMKREGVRNITLGALGLGGVDFNSICVRTLSSAGQEMLAWEFRNDEKRVARFYTRADTETQLENGMHWTANQVSLVVLFDKEGGIRDRYEPSILYIYSHTAKDPDSNREVGTLRLGEIRGTPLQWTKSSLLSKKAARKLLWKPGYSVADHEDRPQITATLGDDDLLQIWQLPENPSQWSQRDCEFLAGQE